MTTDTQPVTVYGGTAQKKRKEFRKERRDYTPKGMHPVVRRNSVFPPSQLALTPFAAHSLHHGIHRELLLARVLAHLTHDGVGLSVYVSVCV